MTKNNKILPGGAQSLILLRKFFNYIKGVSQHQNRIQLFKRKLTEYLDGIQYTNIFKLIDINKKGKIEQKHLQQFLIINKHYHYPQSINRFFLKYSGQKHYLDYDDLLQSLLPHADYMTVSSTLLSLDNKRSNLFQQRANMQSLAALIISLQIQLFDFDYKQLKLITNLSYQRGVQLWRLLDKNHCNSVDFHTISSFSQQLGIKLNSGDWKNFLHHHFHIIKETISRDYFLKMVECLNQKIRIVNNLKIQRFIMTEQKRKLSVQQNFKKNKIQAIILKKLSKIQKDHLNSAHINPSFNMKKSQVCYQRDIYQNNNIPTQDKKLSVQNKSLTLNKTKQTVDMTATSSPNNTTSNYNSRRDKIDMKQKVSKSMNLTKRKENYKREFSQKKLLFGKIGYCNPKGLIKAAFFN